MAGDLDRRGVVADRTEHGVDALVEADGDAGGALLGRDDASPERVLPARRTVYFE